MGTERVASSLVLPPGYGESKAAKLLSWESVESKLVEAKNYWLATTGPEGRPHVTPVWGVWREAVLYFTGIPTARWARNLAENSAAAVHLESGSSVVIVDGVVVDIPAIEDQEVADYIVAQWTAKYGTLVPDPADDGMYCLQAKRARAWTDFPADATKWAFGSNA
jgi:hypothetical protein